MKRQKLAILINMAMLAPLSSWANVPQNVDERWQQPTITTHPDKPYYPNSNVVNRKNLFDWRTQHYQIGMSSLNGAEELKMSPFYICEVESLYNVPGGKMLTGDIMGPNGKPVGTDCARSISKSILDKVPDMDPNEGWEILKFNLGYKMSHYENAKETWSADGNDSWSSNQYPYIILYNRLTAKLRVMSYMGASDIGTGLSVKMSVKGKAKIFNTNQSSDARFYQESVTGFGGINNVQDGGWGLTDFVVEFDPCAPGEDIDFDIHIFPKKVETLELYGHAVGTSHNITDEDIGNPKKYLMNVSGSLENNLDQAGNFTVSELDDLKELFDGVNDSGTNMAVADDAMNAASGFLSGLAGMFFGQQRVEAGLNALSGVTSGIGSIFGTQASAVSDYSKIMPQISFSEVYLRGESSAQDQGITVKLKLPGSRSTVWNNDLDSNASSSRSYPLYDEPMGLFTLLTTPTVHTYKKYEKISDKIGFKVTTSFKPSNVIFASNSKSGLYFNGWSGQSEGDVAVTGRIKVKYLAGPDATVNFSNFNDIDGDNSEYNYVNVKTNGRDMKLYTVVSDDVSLMHLGHFLGSDKGAPKITASGDTVLVDNVSLVVTAKNHGSTIKDHNLNSSINLIDEKDESGRRFPYYLVMKEYPVEFNSHSNQKSFNPSEDINRLINTGQLGGVTHDNDLLGLQLNLGRNNGIKVQGYCDVQGEYNNTHEIRSDGEYSIIADEDMNYYTYEPKQVSSPGEAILDVTRDPCIICARSETWPFYSFNLNEYISRYGFREPKEVTLRINRQSIAVYQMYLYDYAKNYLFSANKSTKPMTDNSHGEGIPKYSTFISNTDWNGQDFNVTEQFKNALNRVKNSNGKYELPRVSVVLDYVPGYGTYTVFSSENDRLDAPQIIINFDDEL